MPGVESRVKPSSATDSSPSEEAFQLELNLQRQLEEDIARIFDESIYSDLEVVCGKLKILTHSCILKARTDKFYHKLETILHVKIARSTFDEIYSFISDTYTECNIKHQEKEILKYLKTTSFDPKEEIDNSQEFSTPKCVSPHVDRLLKKTISSSPSTELTKEYYALVPIEGNLLEKELLEQDVLSNAFQSIINSQVADVENLKSLHCNKPTSLTLLSSHTSKSIKHSNSCDILNTNRQANDLLIENNKYEDKSSQKIRSKKISESNETSDHILKEIKSCELVSDKTIETTYSPDSLITDDPSSASDYLSAVYTCSHGGSFVGATSVIVDDNITKMENMFTSSDSGLENTGLLESLTSHKDVTLTDMSLTESTVHDFTTDDPINCQVSASSPVFENRISSSPKPEISEIPKMFNKLSPENNSLVSNLPVKHNEIANCNSSKEEKQRQNEEIVILESSSLSSETGSWESVFPPKLAPRDCCEKFINNERYHCNESNFIEKDNQEKSARTTDLDLKDVCPSLVQKSPFKSTSCFIDAASLVDEEDDVININVQQNESCEVEIDKSNVILPVPSKPVPCPATNKLDFSPNDWSENDNEDSIDTDSIQKDLSPTIFEMTPIPEDSVSVKTIKSNDNQSLVSKETLNSNPLKGRPTLSSSVLMTNTPNNSIMSLKASVLKQYESEESESDISIVGREEQTSKQSQEEENFSKSPQPSCWSSWVVNMSPISKAESEKHKCDSLVSLKRPGDKTCENLRNYSKHGGSLENCSKSRSSVDSDSSERSSHKFYVDLSSLPDPESPKKQNDAETVNEKKNMFSMFIGFDEKSTLKEMPSRLTPLSSKKIIEKQTSQKNKKTKSPNESITTNKNFDPNHTSTFEMYEVLCKDPKISISEIIRLHEKCRKDSISQDATAEPLVVQDCQPKSLSGEISFHSSIRKTILEEEVNGQADALFVKLSDLDKPVSKTDPPAGTNEDRMLDERMTRSIPEHNWADQNQTASLRPNEVISSFHSENALSLNRLFPHLRNEFSRSMPGSLSGRIRQPLRLDASLSSGDIDDQTSEMSSVQSSFCPSIIENSTTEDTSQASSLIGNSQSRLGQDLLRMFLEEIAPDVIVEVSGRRIKAHKCILSSRCQYFAGILSGGWVESAGNVISLPTFSFNVVHFALCHIYSGVSTIPDSISIVELATLADMLGLEGLKEAIMFTLKAKYCHHFHRPCAVCKAGVLECFPLTSVYGLDDLYRKCLKWITKYFSIVWPTKAFATLPSELLEKCYQQLIIDLSLDNCVDTACGCGIAVSVLNSSRWADVVARMCHRVARATANFMAPKLVTVLRDKDRLQLELPYSAMQALDECIRAAIAWAPPDELCRAYGLISDIVKDLRNSRFTKPDLITNGNTSGHDNILSAQARAWLLICEQSIVKDANRVCCTQAYGDLSSDQRRRLQELGCMNRPTVVSGQSPLPQNRRSRNSQHGKSGKSHNWPSTSVANDLDLDQMRMSFIPYSLKPPPQDSLKNNIIFQDLKKTSRTAPPKVRTTKAQEERAKFNLTKSTLSQERLNTKAAVKPFEKTKPRYLEPKISHELYKKMFVPKVISSSQTSIQSHNFRESPVKIRQADETQPLVLPQPGMAALRPGAETQVLSQDNIMTAPRPRSDNLSHLSYDNLTTSSRSRNNTKTHTLLYDSSMTHIRPRVDAHMQALLQDSLAFSSRPRTEAQPLSQINLATSSRSRTKTRAQNISQDSLGISSQPRNEAQRVSIDGSNSRPRIEVPAQVLKQDNSAMRSSTGARALSRDNLAPPLRSRPKTKAQNSSQDSLTTSSRPHTAEPSTDSLSESQSSNKYATYTKTKHTAKVDSKKNTAIQPSAENQKIRSKIPVYLTQTSKSSNLIQNSNDSQSRRSRTSNTSANTSTTTSSVQSRSKNSNRTLACSLMNATKSSSAKMVTKVVKESGRAKSSSKTKISSKRTQRRLESEQPMDIPVMERSGTFLKDEPTFGDRSQFLDTDDSD